MKNVKRQIFYPRHLNFLIEMCTFDLFCYHFRLELDMTRRPIFGLYLYLEFEGHNKEETVCIFYVNDIYYHMS